MTYSLRNENLRGYDFKITCKIYTSVYFLYFQVLVLISKFFIVEFSTIDNSHEIHLSIT